MTDIVVIGNGPSVLERRVGSLIDQFLTVVRINNYVIAGYEDHVGSKEDVWTRSGTDAVFDRIDEHIPTVLWFVPLPGWEESRQRIGPIMRRVDAAGENHVLVERRQIEDLTDRYFGGRTDVRPTTGLYTIFYFLEKHQQVHIHGFDFFETHKTQMHYFDESVKKRMNGHDPDFERQIVQEHIRSGRLVTI